MLKIENNTQPLTAGVNTSCEQKVSVRNPSNAASTLIGTVPQKPVIFCTYSTYVHKYVCTVCTQVCKYVQYVYKYTYVHVRYVHKHVCTVCIQLW